MKMTPAIENMRNAKITLVTTSLGTSQSPAVVYYGFVMCLIVESSTIILP